ncbi:hypothetical protein DFJ74DRAFT_667898 [Hyaloraphidium curvatum]|nr:hypothetical protein DFJ74DRAFT_667898 [Hyaloraphidium curvatum]
MVSSKDVPTSRAKKAASSVPAARPTAPKPAKGKKAAPSAEDLLAKAGELAAAMDFPLAVRFAKRATETEPELPQAWEVLGSLLAETGEVAKAREAFAKAAELDPEGGAGAWLFLAQLSTGKEAVRCYEKGAELVKKDLEAGLEPAEEEEARKALAGVYCGIAEIYMTDLCDEPDAESRCSDLIHLALSAHPSSPEPHQLHASLLLTQSRPADALAALERGIALWPPDAEYGFRLDAAKLLIELGETERAVGVLEALRDEDSEVAEAWYALGWAWYLKGRGGVKPEDGEEGKGEEKELAEEKRKERDRCWEEAREALLMVVKLHDRTDIPTDDEAAVRAHAGELLAELDAVLPPRAPEEEGEEDEEMGWEDVEDGDGDGEAEEGETMEE